MKEASFSLRSYKFNHVLLDMVNINPDIILDIDIKPSGKFLQEKSEFLLSFEFIAKSEDKIVIDINCMACYYLNGINKIDEIPQYFYSNIIAILFPYVRAFISNLSLQANYKPIVLPTMNLSNLKDDLKAHVIVY